jgi:deazaflavin-dependent oxidoreductase (nitroreductase family)
MADDIQPRPAGDVNLLIADHLQRYLETDGAEGYLWRGKAPILVLTTIGRRSAQVRQNTLIFGRDGDRYLLVASKGGAQEHPDWYRNLAANPDVDIQVQAQRLRVHASVASEPERSRLWKIMAEVWPPYDEYQELTDRLIPVVVLEPVAG